MRTALFRNLLWAGPPAAIFLVLLPLAAHYVDRHYDLTWPSAPGLLLLAVVLMATGAAIAFWSTYCLASLGRGTPNPMAPPQRLVVGGPYRFSRNPMMLGAWVLGLGMALALRSYSLLAAWGLIIVSGCIYVRVFEEPQLLEQFGEAYRDYARVVPRWVPPGRRSFRNLESN